jgi:hypothetical protein
MRDMMTAQSVLEHEIENLILIERLNELANIYGDRFAQMVFDKAGKDLNQRLPLFPHSAEIKHPVAGGR